MGLVDVQHFQGSRERFVRAGHAEPAFVHGRHVFRPRIEDRDVVAFVGQPP